MQVTTIIGTRPEIIKMAPLIPLLDKYFEHKLIFTSQHYSKNMVGIFFNELGVRKPDIFLDVKSSDYAALESAVEQELRKSDAGYVIVYGDTNSTLAAARAAKKTGKKLIHIEAGLRSYDDAMPEERNRIETDKMADYLFAPTELCRKQLAKEGIKKNVFVVGNLVVDACRYFSKKAKTKERGRYILLTAHRQENVDNPKKLLEILEAISKLNTRVIFPIHPRTKKRAEEFNVSFPTNVKLIEPVGYLEFLSLLKNAQLIITDSGGVQEEAITLNIPCITIRGGNERWESVEAGGNFVVGTEPQLIASYAKQILEGTLGRRMRKAHNPYGRNVAKKTISILKKVIQ